MRTLCLALILAAGTALGAPKPIREPVTLKKVIRFLKKNPEVQTIGDFLGYLPESFRSHFTLIHDSHSSQNATPENPRAIVYGRDGTFVLAFNGSREQLGYYQLETIQWHPRRRKFEFRKFDFPKPEDTDRRVKYSRANPKDCRGCHGKGHEFRPNWEAYSEWPTAYAGHDDELAKDGKELNRSLEDFFEAAKPHDRYSKLVGLEASYEPTPAGRTKVQHNIQLSTVLTQLNFQRMARLMEATPDFSFHRYDVMAMLAGCVGTTYPWDFLQSFEPRGIDVQYWSMSFFPAPEAYNLTTPNSWKGELLARLLPNQPDLADLFWRFEGYYGYPQAQALQGNDRATCDGLRDRRDAESSRHTPR